MRLITIPGSPHARIVRMAVIEKSLELKVALEAAAPAMHAVGAAAVPTARAAPHHAGDFALLPANDPGPRASRDPDAGSPVGSPAGGPLLVTDDGRLLRAVTPILLHLDAVAPHPPLLRLDGADAWRGVSAFGRAIALLDTLPGGLAGDDAPVQRARRIALAADRFEAEIAEGGFCGGATGWPDAAWVALAAVLDHGRHCLSAAIWFDGRPALAEWFEQASHRPSFLATSPTP